MEMLQEYWASTVIFIGIFSQCIIVQVLAQRYSRIQWGRETQTRYKLIHI